MTSTQSQMATQVFKVYIKTTPERIWDAITKPEWTARYGYTGLADFDLRPGGAYSIRPTKEFREASEERGFPVPDAMIVGEVLEADPPRKLVTTFKMLLDPEIANEAITKVTHEIEEVTEGVCCLTLVHELDGAPKLAVLVSGGREAEGAGGGYPWVLSDLKSLLETGFSFSER